MDIIVKLATPCIFCVEIVSLMYQLNAHIGLILLLFIKCLLHVSAQTAPSLGRTLVICSKLSADCNVYTMITKHKMYHVGCKTCLRLSYAV